MKYIRVMAVLYFPDTDDVKYLDWSECERKVGLTVSTSSSEALNRFLVNTKTFIKVLTKIKTIWFFEEVRYTAGRSKKINPTYTIIMTDDMTPKVINH